MVTQKSVDEQLKKIGCNFQVWGRAEARELCNILMPSELINECLNGRYEGGYAMLCSTNQRIILIDRKPMFLTLEDIRYDMIAEIDYSHRLMNASVRIFTPTKTLFFTSWNHLRLRRLVTNSQQRVMEIRHYQQNETEQFRQPEPQFQSPQTQNQPVLQQELPQLQPLLGQVFSRSPLRTSTDIMNNMSAPSTTTASTTPYRQASFTPMPINPFVKIALTTKRRTRFN